VLLGGPALLIEDCAICCIAALEAVSVSFGGTLDTGGPMANCGEPTGEPTIFKYIISFQNIFFYRLTESFVD
jgi:hypothetical protein